MHMLLGVLCLVVLTAAACRGGGADRTQTTTTPAASASPVPILAAASRDQALRLIAAVQQYIDTSAELSRLMNDARFNDAAWRRTTTEATTRMHRAVAVIRETPLPACYHAAHKELLQFARLMDEAMVIAAQAVRDANAPQFAASQRQLHEANAAMDRATDLMRRASC